MNNFQAILDITVAIIAAESLKYLVVKILTKLDKKIDSPLDIK